MPEPGDWGGGGEPWELNQIASPGSVNGWRGPASVNNTPGHECGVSAELSQYRYWVRRSEETHL